MTTGQTIRRHPPAKGARKHLSINKALIEVVESRSFFVVNNNFSSQIILLLGDCTHVAQSTTQLLMDAL